MGTCSSSTPTISTVDDQETCPNLSISIDVAISDKENNPDAIVLTASSYFLLALLWD